MADQQTEGQSSESRQASPAKSPLLRAHDREWMRIALSSSSCDTIRRWGRHQTALAGFTSPAEVLEHLQKSAPQAQKDAILHALLTLAKARDELAGFVLTQALLPGLITLAKTFAYPRGENTFDDAIQRVFAEFWFVIMRPNLIPPGRVAGRLLLDTRHQVTAHQRRPDVFEHHTIYAEPDAETPDTFDTATQAVHQLEPQPDPHGGLEDLLGWLSGSSFSPDDTHLLATVFLRHHGDHKASAEELGISHDSCRQRVARLKPRIKAALEAYRRDLVDAAGA